MMRHSTTRPAIGQSSGRKGPRGRDPFAGPAEWFRHQPGPDYNASARANVTTRARGGMALPLPGAHSRWFVPAAGAGHLPGGARFLLSMNQCSFVVPPAAPTLPSGESRDDKGPVTGHEVRCGDRGISPGQRGPPFSGDAVERVRPRPDGASEVAKRMEGAGLPALSDSDTPPGDLPPHRYVPGPCYARPYGWLTR